MMLASPLQSQSFLKALLISRILVPVPAAGENTHPPDQYGEMYGVALSRYARGVWNVRHDGALQALFSRSCRVAPEL